MIIKKDPDVIGSYFEDSSNLKGGYAQEVLFPENINELSHLLEECNFKRTAVTISGGGTGTAGSRIPFGGIIISTEKLNRISHISVDEMSAGLQAGVMVDDLKTACENRGLFYTSHPTERSAFVGGTVATNASGARSFRYGPTRRYVKRLEIVLPDGRVLDIRRGESRLTAKDSKIKIASGSYIDVPLPSYRMPDVKSTAGYFAKDGMDPIDLFIGQEGTLSVIANIEMALVKKPAGIFSCFVFFRDTQDAWAFSDDLKKVAGVLSIEYFDDNALDILRSRSLDVPERSKAAVFFEIESAERGADAADKCMELIAEHNARADDTWVAMDEKRAEEFTGYRHSIPEGINEIVKRSRFQKLSADIAVPHERFKEMMNYYISSFRRTALRHIIFGHIGESHVHVNILPGSEVELKAGRDLLYDFARKGVAIGGTVSAEHGIGKIKHKFLELMYGRKGIMEMARIKKAFDPNCILGLDNIFPRELLKSV